MSVEKKKTSDLYNACTDIAGKAKVLQTAVVDTLSEGISLDTALLCVVLSESVAGSINCQLKAISQEIYNCC